MEPGLPSPHIDTSRAHPARMYDYYLGGTENFPADREAAEAVLSVAPVVREAARENRAFLQRAVRFLVGEAGLRQIIDVGAGIPAGGNVHEIARLIAPGVRVAYVDNDPIVQVHANALLAGDASTRVALADLRDPAAVLACPEVRELIDLSQPVGLLLLGVLYFITDDEAPGQLIGAYRDSLAPGSYLALSHGCATRWRRTSSRAPPRRTTRPPPRWCSEPGPDQQILRRVRAGYLGLVRPAAVGARTGAPGSAGSGADRHVRRRRTKGTASA